MKHSAYELPPTRLTDFGGTSFHGASRLDRELYSWQPPRRSADRALLPEINTLISRIHDLARNSGLISGGIQLLVDSAIGTGLKLHAIPDWRVLGLTADWARNWAREVEERFGGWAEDIDCYSDLGRRLNFHDRTALICRSLLLSGEGLAIAEWRPNRGGYATAIRLVDSARLETPPKLMRRGDIAGGIYRNRDGAPIAYSIRNSHPTDPVISRRDREYRRVPAFTPWGRRRVLHVYLPELVAQSRGNSALSAGLRRAKKLDRWEDATLEAAIINAVFAGVIESDLSSALEAVGGRDLTEYAHSLVEWSGGKGITFDGVKIPHLFPGEKLKLNKPEQPTMAFTALEDAFNRHLAATLGLSYEQYSRNYSDTSYSGAQSGRSDSWRTILSRRAAIAQQYASQEYALWLEEAISRGDVVLPNNAPAFNAAKSAYCRSAWLGPGKGHLNPLQEANAHAIELKHGSSTLAAWCSDQGRDWEATLEQRARELRKIRELETEFDITFGAEASPPAISEQNEL